MKKEEKKRDRIMSQRIKKVNELVKQEISKILLKK